MNTQVFSGKADAYARASQLRRDVYTAVYSKPVARLVGVPGALE